MLIPLLFMSEVVGRLFREFAITLSISILISAVVSLTLVPMLCAKMLRTRAQTEARGQSAIARQAERAFQRLIAQYDRLLIRVLEHQGLVLWIATGTVVLTVLLYIVIPKGFFPVQDTGILQGTTEGAPSVSFAAMIDRQQALAELILHDPDVDSLSSFVGIDGTNTTLNNGRYLINLKPKDQRSDSIVQTMARLSDAARGVSGIKLYLQPVQDLTIDSTVGSRAVSVHPRRRQQQHPSAVGAEAARAAAARPGARQRLDQLRRQRPDRADRHRSRYRRALWRDRRHDR